MYIPTAFAVTDPARLAMRRVLERRGDLDTPDDTPTAPSDAHSCAARASGLTDACSYDRLTRGSRRRSITAIA